MTALSATRVDATFVLVGHAAARRTTTTTSAGTGRRGLRPDAASPTRRPRTRSTAPARPASASRAPARRTPRAVLADEPGAEQPTDRVAEEARTQDGHVERDVRGVVGPRGRARATRGAEPPAAGVPRGVAVLHLDHDVAVGLVRPQRPRRLEVDQPEPRAVPGLEARRCRAGRRPSRAAGRPRRRSRAWWCPSGRGRRPVARGPAARRGRRRRCRRRPCPTDGRGPTCARGAGRRSRRPRRRGGRRARAAAPCRAAASAARRPAGRRSPGEPDDRAGEVGGEAQLAGAHPLGHARRGHGRRSWVVIAGGLVLEVRRGEGRAAAERRPGASGPRCRSRSGRRCRSRWRAAPRSPCPASWERARWSVIIAASTPRRRTSGCTPTHVRPAIGTTDPPGSDRSIGRTP